MSKNDIQAAAQAARNGNGIAARREPAVIEMLEQPGWDKRFAYALAGTGVDSNRFKRLAITAIRMNSNLQECSAISLLGSLMTAAQLGLEVNTPLDQAYLVPFKGECTLMIGYQGYMTLARRSGLITNIMAHSVYEGDVFRYQLGLNPDIYHEPTAEDREDPRKITHVYAYARFRDGFEPAFVVLTRNKVEQYRRRSAYANKGPWVNDWEAMAWKTAIRRLKRWLPMSAQLAQADQADGSIVHYDDATGVKVVTPEFQLAPPEMNESPIPATDAVEPESDIYATEGGSSDERG